jgi:hypothetical protein
MELGIPPSESSGLFVRVTIFLTSMICVQPHGSGPFSSSLWWRSPPDISSVTLDQDVLCKLPSLWGRVAYSVNPVTAWAGPLLKAGIPAWASPFLPQLSAASELFVINLVAHHDPQPDTQLPRRRDPRLAHSFLDELAPIEAFQLRVFPYRMHRRLGPQIAQ